MTKIMKFGGTSVGDAAAMRGTATILERHHRDEPVVAVVSAMSGMTNRLLEFGTAAESGDAAVVETARASILAPHRRALSDLVADTASHRRVIAEITKLVDDAARLLYSVYVLREMTPRARDRLVSFGERLSSRILAAHLNYVGVPAVQVDADRVIATDRVFGNASPMLDMTRSRAEEVIAPLVRRGMLPIVTGFIGATCDGLTTTLGRGGSDFSASILGNSLKASEIWIWTDVNGVMTADPRIVEGAETIERISYQEATELAYFGAEVIHPKTMYPAEECGIPIRIKNTFAPDDDGTLISRTTASGRSAKAIASISDLAVITVEGRGLIDVSRVTMRIFEAVGRTQANVYMISQASSQHSVSFVVGGRERGRVIDALSSEFRQDLEDRRVLSLGMDEEVAIVAVVGGGMKGTPGVAGKVFGTMGSEGINIVAIAQGSSELNISFVVGEADVSAAVRALHRTFLANA